MILTAVLPLLVVAWWRFDSVVALGLAVLLRITYQQVAGEHVEDVLRRAESPGRDLDVLRPALELLETSTFECDTLRALQARLEQSEVRASAAIRSLRRYLEMHEWTHNVFFAPIAAVLMWNSHLAWAVAPLAPHPWRSRGRMAPRRRGTGGALVHRRVRATSIPRTRFRP